MKRVRQEPPGLISEGARAAWWRQRIMRLEIKELAELTGYSVTAIRCFESNANTAGELFGEKAWQRYRMACAGVLFSSGLSASKRFEWDYKTTLGVPERANQQR
jgi:hypothetical protein